MDVALDSKGIELFAESVGGSLAGILGNDNASDIKSKGLESVDKAHYFKVIGNSKVAANFIFFNIGGIDNDKDLCLVFHFTKKFYFGIVSKTRKNP